MEVAIVTGLFAKGDVDVNAERPIQLSRSGSTLIRVVHVFVLQNGLSFSNDVQQWFCL